MRDFLSILAVCLMLSLSASAENKGKNDNQADKQNTEAASNDTAKSSEDATATSKEKGGDKEILADTENATKESGDLNTLSLISLIIASLGLGVGAYAFFFSNNKYQEMKGRYHKLKDDLGNLELEVNGKIGESINTCQTKLERSIEECKAQINDNVSFLLKKQEEEKPDDASEPTITEEQRYVSKTFYGVFKPRLKGVNVEQLSSVKEENSTLKIVTESDIVANVHLVDNIGKTQFGSLNDSAVEVLEGNPQAYDTIIEIEPGKMRLEEENWIIVSKIKVKLS